MIVYQDFFPTKTGSFMSSAHEPLASVVERANQWITSANVEVINVETVVLPNASSWGDDDSGKTALRTSGETSSWWFQIVRVWFRPKR